MGIVAVYARVLGLLAPDRTIAIVLVVANLALATFQFLVPVLFGRVVDALATGTGAMPLVFLWALVGFLSVAASVVIALHADRLAHRRRLAAMSQYFEHAIALPPTFMGEQHSGRLMKVMLRGTDQLFSLWLSFFREHMGAIFTLIVLIPSALFMNWRLALVLFILMIVFAVLNYIVVSKTFTAQGNVERYHSELAARAGDVMGNVTVVQAFTRLTAEVQGVKDAMSRLLAAQYPVLNWWATLNVLTNAASTIAMVAIFAVGTVLHGQGGASVGEIVAFVAFAQLLIGRLEQLSGFVNNIFFQTHAIREFFEVLDTTSSVKEKPGAPALDVKSGEIAFQGVTFHYPNSKAGVSDLTFTVKPGETVALVGPTGSGKSTALSFLTRSRDPNSGAILIDGQDIRDVQISSLRSQIGVVFQDAGLFNRSIRENLQLGKPDAGDQDMLRAIALAEAADFVLSKPDGLDTIVTERGQNLSGGERQRLAIARAILKNAPILILDEATSALDVETEAKISRALSELARGRTTILIAHRLSTVRKANMIVVLKEGRIIERGSFDELVALGGFFAKLAAEGGLAGDQADAAAKLAAEQQAAAQAAMAATHAEA
jgi:glucan exporter ATP-binding protein